MRRLDYSKALQAGDKIFGRRATGRYVDATVGSTCPHGAAFLGTLHGTADVQKFLGLVRNSSRESLCDFIHHGLMKTFPHLGRSIREFPQLYKRLRHDCPGVLEAGEDKRRSFTAADGSKIQPYSAKLYRSLFGVISQLHDRYDWPKPRIGLVLAEAGL